MLRKLLISVISLLSVLISVVILISINHPIIMKWISGSAKDLGKPIHAIVYTDGKINNTIKVFHVDKYWDTNEQANNYIINLTNYDSLGMLKFFNVNLTQEWIGRPAGTSIYDYDFIAGHLFQSETGGHFTPFQDDMKGYGFDPELTFTDNEIKFKVPPKRLKFDSVRIELK